jgi:hypothetical protein
MGTTSKAYLSFLFLAALLVQGCSPEFNAKRKRTIAASTPTRGLKAGEGFQQTQGGGAFGESTSFKISGLNVGGSVAQKPGTSSPSRKLNGGGVNGQLPAINYQPGQ